MDDDILEYPGSPDKPDWASLYLYRGDEVVRARPIFTGDIFFGVDVQGVGVIETKNVLVIQHPCALRSNGVDLNDSLMVAEVTTSKLYQHGEWQGNYRLMPLPELVAPESHYVGLFTSLYLAIPDSLEPAKRIACLSPVGVNLLLQRWVFHNSRVVVPTWKYDDVLSSQYEEADLIEEWCEIRSIKKIEIAAATREAAAWFDDDGGSGVKRRVMLENRQYRAQIRKAMRKYAQSLN